MTRIGAIGDLTCFSFYATKNLTTGEGGMVTTDSAEAAARIRTAALHGLSRDAWRRYETGGAAHYDVTMAGFKYNMMDLQAAIGLRQLDRLDAMHDRRDSIWRRYDEALAHLPLTRPAPPDPGMVHARHLYTVLVDEERSGWSRDGLQAALAAEGIGTAIHFTALHLHSYYQQRFGLRRGQFPHAEYISDRTLSLPLSASLTDNEVDRVIATVRRVIARLGNKVGDGESRQPGCARPRPCRAEDLGIRGEASAKERAGGGVPRAVEDIDAA
jgi:dTDP-4-amino-4,6-dideoxygalactose transaminase